MSKLHQIFNIIKGEAKKQEQRKSSIIAPPVYNRIDMEMDKLLSAVGSALDVSNCDRVDLYDIYANSEKDSQVITEMGKAESCLITEPYIIESDGKRDDEVVKLLKRPWFDNFLIAAMSPEFYQYTLIEFGQLDDNGEFVDCKVFPRKNINPFKKHILLSQSDSEGISYADSLTEFYLLELGDPYKLGKLETISKEVIWKTFARCDWSEFNERWGKPVLDFAIDTDDPNEIEQKRQMAENFGSNCYIIRDVSEEVTVHTANGTGASDTFEKQVRLCDEQIAKLINGQFGTSDEKSFVGSAEVHERILDEFTKARLTHIQNIINYKLFPFLISHGYQLEGKEFKYIRIQPQKVEKQVEQQEKETQEREEGTNDRSVTGKKKVQTLPDWVLNIAP